MSRALEIALRKQQVLLESNIRREALATHGAGLRPLFDAADRLVEGLDWARRHPELIAGGAAMLLAASPAVRRFSWRWGKRGFVAWQFLRERSAFPRPARG